MCVKDLICNKIKEGDYCKIVNVLVDCIDPECKDYACKKIYKIIYGDELIPELCEEFIKCLTDTPKWTLEETNAVAKRLDYDFSVKPYSPEEFRTAMLYEYIEHSVPLKESNISLEANTYGRIANSWLSHDRGRLVREFFHHCCN